MVRGDAANELIAFVADPNVSIQESKCLTGNIEPGRKSRGRRVVSSGPLVPPAPGGQPPRDLPQLRDRPMGMHGISSGAAKEGEQT